MSLGALVVILLLAGITIQAQDSNGGSDMSQFAGNPRFPAPDFPTGVDWLNVPGPLTFQQLRGKVVLLDFWTYGCINCIHMIPVLHRLEAKYGDALAVIGVHSAKFANEGQTENIRQIVQRYGLEHPVINDKDFAVWATFQPYGVNAWPTFALVDPRGNLYAVEAGEIPFEAFDTVIGGMIANFESLGEIRHEPLQLVLEGSTEPASALSFPGKVLADPDGNRLFIADSSHNRLVIADLTTYEVLEVIGSGAQGFNNGAYGQATFDKPQGMALKDNLLYVADTNNHAIRAINLTGRTVTTIAGTGKQGYNRSQARLPLEADLSSPWDLAFADNGNLYIAMAGTHQIWVLSVDRNSIGPIVGSGREGLVEGGLPYAELAQPSGLYFRDGILYFADSESSSIRAANLKTNRTETLAGPPMNDLFAYGDADGGFGDSRLQHPLAVVGDADGLLYVADTYNSKIKLLDPVKKDITTLFGQAGVGGFRDGSAAEAQFDEPGGLSYSDGKLYVADTNNHAIRVIDLAAGVVSTVTFPNPEKLQIADRVTVIGSNSASGATETEPAQTVQPGSGLLALNIVLPAGYKLNGLAPFSVEWSSDGDPVQIAESDRVFSQVAPELPITIPVTLAEGAATLTGSLTIYYCEAVNESLCFIDRVTLTIPVTVSAEATNTTLKAEREVILPQVPAGSL
jgi:DNA-binding beta-propeller fold protein YncE